MKKIQTDPILNDFLLWRENLFQGLIGRKETVIELIDALSSNQQAHSVMEADINERN